MIDGYPISAKSILPEIIGQDQRTGNSTLMEIKLPVEVAKGYSSASQQIRVVTEYWVSKSVYCPSCGNSLSRFGNNMPVADYYCKECYEEFELKSKHGAVGKKIVDGAYATMIERLNANNHPNFFFLTYNKTTFEIIDFLTIPKYFFVAAIIEKRKPLNFTARRAGWVGCNIMVNNIPDFGKIYFIQNGAVKSKHEVLNKWRRTNFVKNTREFEAKGWLLDILICIERIRKEEFSLQEVYQFEEYLKTRHPLNNNVRAKIRQQLQFLRDMNHIVFWGQGNYKIKTDET